MLQVHAYRQFLDSDAVNVALDTSNPEAPTVGAYGPNKTLQDPDLSRFRSGSCPLSPLLQVHAYRNCQLLRLSQVHAYRQFLDSDAVNVALNTSKSPLTAIVVLKKICDHPYLLQVV